MRNTEQFGTCQQPSVVLDAPSLSLAHYAGLLGNQRLQAPTSAPEFGETEVWLLLRIREKTFGTAQPSSKLAILKSQHFTLEGREERIRESLAALAEPQTINLTLQEWKEIVEEVEDEDED